MFRFVHYCRSNLGKHFSFFFVFLGFENFEQLLAGAHWMVGHLPHQNRRQTVGCSEACRLLTWALLCRTNTSAALLWRQTCPSCWLFWASGTSTSSRRRLTPYCPMTSTCTASPPTSSRSDPLVFTVFVFKDGRQRTGA